MGWFGELWAWIATALGVDVVRLEAPWGEAIYPQALADALDRHPGVRTVFMTHNETSTGVRNDLLGAGVSGQGPGQAPGDRHHQRRAGPFAADR